MATPRIPIEIDEETGVWSTNELPMLYMPRHFFINNHTAVEQALGVDAYATQLYAAGYKSAWTWCDYEAKQQGMSGIDVFHHYMHCISQRGWGQFDGSNIDAETGCGEVILRNSCFVLQAGDETFKRKMCYLFAGWFPGSLAWVMRDTEAQIELQCVETQCACETNDHCVFTVSRAS